MSKAIIFDFGGTIADSFGLFVSVLHKMLAKDAPLSQYMIDELRGKQIKEITAELGVKPWQLPRFVTKGRRQIADNYDSVAVFKGMPKIIKELSSAGYELFIVSTNDEKAIHMFLERNQLDDYFKHIYANIGLSGKARFLKRLLKQHGYSSSEAIYVGDEVRDIEAAHDANLKCLSVSWGYANENSLRAHHPDSLVTDCKMIPETVGYLYEKR